MVFVCDHCHFELEAAAKPCQLPGLWEAEPHPHCHSGGGPGFSGPEAGGRLARCGTRPGWL